MKDILDRTVEVGDTIIGIFKVCDGVDPELKIGKLVGFKYEKFEVEFPVTCYSYNPITKEHDIPQTVVAKQYCKQVFKL